MGGACFACGNERNNGGSSGKPGAKGKNKLADPLRDDTDEDNELDPPENLELISQMPAPNMSPT